MEERYKVYGLADDVKPAITTMLEFTLVDQAAALFEHSSECRMPRDLVTDKC